MLINDNENTTSRVNSACSFHSQKSLPRSFKNSFTQFVSAVKPVRCATTATMKSFTLPLLLLLVLQGTEGKRWNTNKDSIIVDAQYSSEEEGIFLDPGEKEKAECFTADGEAGECVTVQRCHPVLSSEKGRLRNSGLALTYAQSEDGCSGKNSLEGSGEKKEGVDKDKQEIGQKVICCARDRIQYDLRSDLETYTTTFTPLLGSGGGGPGVTELPPTATGDVVVEDLGQPTIPPNVEDIVVVVEETTVLPVTGSDTDPELDLAVTTTQPAVSVPAPEQEPEQVEPEVAEEPAPTSACASQESYGDWPVFQDYPWLATIQTLKKTGPTCSGSLITESHVLSAAHCIHRFNSRDVARMQIRIGFSKRSGRNDTFNDYYVLRNASKIIFHKRFHEQSKMDNNIALIKLDEPVEFDDHISPIGVFNGLPGFDGGNCSAAEAGWIKFGNRRVTGVSPGVIHFVEAPSSDFHLRESLSRVLTNGECNQQLNSQINQKMICAKAKSFEEPNVSTDFFRWNDGGPLVVRVGKVVQQIGIKSWAYEGQQYPTVFTRVDSYLDWIRNNLKM